MSTSAIFGQEASDESTTEQRGRRAICPECEGRVVAADTESVCRDCGLVVHEDALAREPSMRRHGSTEGDGPAEWALETTNQLRVDKGLHTTFFLSTDGNGNSLSAERMDRLERLRRRHKRFTMESKRDKRLNEGFRDIGMLGANLDLPEHVTSDAARFLEAAKAARLPGGRVAWESLAAGAVLLAARAAGFEREPDDVATYAKTSCERLCAAARKLRLQTDVDAPPARGRAVDRVVANLEAAGVDIDVETALDLVRVGERLLEVADSEGIGPGTSQMSVAGAAVYAADARTPGKAVTQREVVEAVSETVSTSRHRIKRYSVEIREAVEGRHQPTGPELGLVADD